MEMNRISRESPAGLRNLITGSQSRRGRSVTRDSTDRDDNLDLFSQTTRPADSDVLIKLGKISVGSTEPVGNGVDDLLSLPDGGKHDYDWLLTPPETPMVSSSDTSEPPPPITAPRSRSSVRSASTTKPSRLSMGQSEHSYSTRPARSSSATRPSITNIYSTYSSTSNRTSVLNTSIASITSSRPSTPSSRPTATRSTTPITRSTSVRSSTPAKIRPPAISSSEKPRPSQNPRPSTPTSHPQIPTNLTLASRSNSRPSTPTRRTPVPASTTIPGRSSSVGRVPPGRSTAPSSRGSSPSPRAHTPPQPIVLPDFPFDAPPNLRTTVPDRPASNGRSRPGAALTIRTSDPVGPLSVPRRHSSPIATQGKLLELSRRGQSQSNGHVSGSPEIRKNAVSRPAKPVSSTESTGFGRTISKKSLDMAVKHMDIRQSTKSTRGLTSNSLFPQSIRSSAPKVQHAGISDYPSSVGSNGSENGDVTYKPLGHDHKTYSESTQPREKLIHEPNIYESSRYDVFLLKEDLKYTDWLHSVEDKSNQSPGFGHGFELLSEPFCLI